MAEGALSDVKILDLTHHIAGPYCTKLLADYGADVVKIERPGIGDIARRMGPFPNDEIHPEKSGLFLYLNTNKRSITLNLKSSSGQKMFKELVRNADILVENFRPGVMDSFGLDYETLEKINPKLVMGSISNFGQSGPYRDFKSSELILLMMGGDGYSLGATDREPTNEWPTARLYAGGACAAGAILGAFLGLKYQGLSGQYIDVSLVETQAAGVDRRYCAILGYQYCGDITPRVEGWVGGYPYGVYPCKDGFIQISGGRMHWDRVVKMLGEPEFLRDPKWTEPGAQSDWELKGEFEAFFISWTMERTKQEIWEAGQPYRVVSAPLNTTADLVSDSHLASRGVFTDIDHSVTGKVKYLGRPFIMGQTPWSVKRSAPLLGQHNGEIYGALGYTNEDLVRLRQTGII